MDQSNKPSFDENTKTDFKLEINANGLINGLVSLNKQNKECSNDKSNEKNEKVIKRDQWRTKFDFLIACLGFSIGLGNVWRFPYLCYKNGGGAFLLPYFISVFLVGIPLFFLEVSLGQFMNRAAIVVWNICPIFKGIGFGSTLINFFLSCYYTIILTWGLQFLFESFTFQLPWTTCNNSWNTEHCRLFLHSNQTDNFLASDSVTEFWERRILRISDGIEHLGTIPWDLALCLLLAWIIIFLCICKGIKTSGKVMYVTASMPYVFMIILLIRTCLLEGAGSGLKYYLKPNWAKLADMEVWSDAGTQIYFSYSIGLGVLMALGSYNKFNHNAFRDCIIFATTNSFTSLLAGCVIFATLGYMSFTSNVPIDQVAESGPGLAFVIYPKAIGTMPLSPLWSICFFIMILLLGIDSMFAGVEGFVAAIGDCYPKILARDRNRYLFLGLTCIVSYCIGLFMITNGGMYIFLLFDHYSGSRIILLIGFLECIAIGYVYGYKRFNANIKSMYGFSFGWITGLFLCIITPLFSAILFVCSVIVYKELEYKRAGASTVYKFPNWAVNFGWIMASTSVFFIPIVMLYQLIRSNGTFKERLKYLITPRYTNRSHTNLNEMKMVDGCLILELEDDQFVMHSTEKLN